MTTTVYKKSYSAPPIDRREALRYAGVRGESAEAEAMLDECINDAVDKLFVIFTKISVCKPSRMPSDS